MSLTDILEELPKLTDHERLLLRDRLDDLADSIEGDELPGSMDPNEILAEAIKRDQELESGAVKPISHEELIGNLRRRFPFLSEH
jgi:hypothetical protein